MAKDKDIERLEAENRELKKINRQLLKKLKQVNKGYRKVREEVEDDEPEEIEEEKEVCPKCYSKSVKELKFSILGKKEKTIKTCEDCGHRITE